MLYIVSTPIGNLGDITFRALEILKEVDLIAAEDTRRTGILLKHYEIHKKMVSYNDHNKDRRAREFIELLKDGKSIALVSDAGTPGISDPGFHIVRECIKENLAVAPIPGASAVLSALTCSGLPTDRFTFYGFLPKKDGQKKKMLNLVKERKETAVFYESPHRIKKTILLLKETIPEDNVVIARELTKKFEEFIRGTASEVYEKTKDRELKGEIVLIIK
ncbi:MAG: 16S rRNA (cytidine(1402)-2'-O)-methyltransferase [Nanoarchaeota archaeon]|nr:16S rRNA (cytidine(1402)-2'-O)-methyltransferase [Nanoarchaeota archaeon]